MQSRKQLLSAIRKQTKPPKGFSQWILVVEQRRLSENLGLLLVEAQLEGKREWSGSISVSLPEHKKFDSNGQELPNKWEAIAIGQSNYNVISFEMRGKSIAEMAKGFLKRSVEEGKLQDFLP